MNYEKKGEQHEIIDVSKCWVPSRTMRSPSSSEGPWPAHSLLICIRRALFWASFELSSSLAAGLRRREENGDAPIKLGLNDLGQTSNCDYLDQYCDCDLMCDFFNLLSSLCCVLFTKREINHSLV